MLEVALFVLVCCNKDGSKKTPINIIGIIGLVLTVILAFLWTNLLFFDAVIYAVLLVIGNLQGKKTTPAPKAHEEPIDAEWKDTSNNC